MYMGVLWSKEYKLSMTYMLLYEIYVHKQLIIIMVKVSFIATENDLTSKHLKDIDYGQNTYRIPMNVCLLTF